MITQSIIQSVIPSLRRLLGIQGQPQLPSKTSWGRGGEGGRPKIRDVAQFGGLPRIHEA